MTTETLPRLPAWLKRPLVASPVIRETEAALARWDLHTICVEGKCPNRAECYAERSATFLLLGDLCTRGCRFCSVKRLPASLAGTADADEPRRGGGAAAELGLDYIVLTSVTRDDLPDGGAAQFAASIRAAKAARSGLLVEALIPDFGGSETDLDTVLASEPTVLAHNVETVPRLYPEVRLGSDYARSLRVLRRAADAGFVTKSALILGFGETDEEVREVLSDLREAGCRILVLCQYLRPTLPSRPVARFVAPEAFEDWKAEALGFGFSAVEAGPFVRSSYRAERAYRAAMGQA